MTAAGYCGKSCTSTRRHPQRPPLPHTPCGLLSLSFSRLPQVSGRATAASAPPPASQSGATGQLRLSQPANQKPPLEQTQCSRNPFIQRLDSARRGRLYRGAVSDCCGVTPSFITPAWTPLLILLASKGTSDRAWRKAAALFLHLVGFYFCAEGKGSWRSYRVLPPQPPPVHAAWVYCH